MWQKFKALFGAQDMTVGNPSRALLKFALPMLLGNIAQLLYSTVDSIIVGKYVGDLALGAIGVSGGTAQQDIELGVYGKEKLKDVIAWN